MQLNARLHTYLTFKVKESKTLLYREAHSALRLVSIGALYLKNIEKHIEKMERMLTKRAAYTSKLTSKARLNRRLLSCNSMHAYIRI